MHSHDRTLLARLGFADPDKTNPEHDRACRYLSLPENRAALLQVAGAEAVAESGLLPSDDAFCELAISKGEGQYRTTIGFVDVVLVTGRRTYSVRRSQHVWDQEVVLLGVGIEVKISPVSWAEVLRQIKLYRGYLSNLVWILAVRYDVTEEYVAALKNEGVIVIRLGKKFEEWVAQDKKVVASVEEV